MCDSEKSVENVWDLGSIQGWSVALLFLNAHAWIEFPKMHLSFDATPAFFFSCCRPLSHIFMDGTMSENPRAKRDLWKSLIALCQDSKSSHFTIYLPRSTFFQWSEGTSILPHFSVWKSHILQDCTSLCCTFFYTFIHFCTFL